jgi:hypothetical protein
VNEATNKKPTPTPSSVVDLDELRRRRICKKRYGRATLTIVRWGGLRVLGDVRLGQALAAFRTGKASATDVAWAFVRSRIESHSPSFNWRGAHLERLIDLVTDCSDSLVRRRRRRRDLGQERRTGRRPLRVPQPAFPNPWRVLDRDGAIPDGWRGYSGPEKCQALLEAEGVTFEEGRADPAHRVGWEELERLDEAG